MKGQTTPVSLNASPDGKGSYTGETKNKQFLENDVQNETTKATGAIKGMAINVVCDSTRVQDTGAVEQMLYGDLGDRVAEEAGHAVKFLRHGGQVEAVG